MAPKRAAKRSRTDAGPPVAAKPKNPFCTLPDELVQRIMSLIEAVDAWEVARLQQVDRRFRRLVRGVQWEEMQLTGIAGESCDELKNIDEQLIGRMKDRVLGGLVGGAKRVCIALEFEMSVSGGRWNSETSTEVRERCAAAAVSVIRMADGVTELLRALASRAAPVQLERIELDSEWVEWPSGEEQVHAGIFPRLPEHFTAGLLVALSSAQALRSISADEHFVSVLAGALDHLPPYCVQPAYFRALEEVVLTGYSGAFVGDLSANHVAAIARVWPALRRVHLYLSDGAALGMLACLPSLEALRLILVNSKIDDPVDISGGLAILAASPGAATRLRELWFDHLCDDDVLTPRGVAAALSLRALQRLTIAVDPSSAEVLGGLAALEQLRELHFHLRLSGSEDRVKSMLDAAAAGLRGNRSLGRLRLSLTDKEGTASSATVASRLGRRAESARAQVTDPGVDASAAGLREKRSLARLRLSLSDKGGIAGSSPVAGSLAALFRAARPALVSF